MRGANGNAGIQVGKIVLYPASASGPTSTKTAPLKINSGEVIIGQSEQLERWVEHYLELYANQNVVTDVDMNALPSRHVMEELDNLSTM